MTRWRSCSRPGPGELVAEFGLAEQDGLQQRPAADLEVGEHAQLLERGDRQVLRLVDDQQGALAGAQLLVEPLLDRIEQPRLLDRAGVEAEPLRDQPEHVVALDLGRDQADRVQPGAIDIGQQMRDQGRFARPDLAGDDDEALALGEAVAEIGHRLPVGPAVEPEARVGRQLEGLSGQAVMLGVHIISPCGRRSLRRCI